MAILYMDPENGNDANDGSTFALRFQTVNGGATAARIAPGDTIRIIASPPSTDTGIDATWTKNSPTVTLNSALNVLISDCESAWTASANVTATTVATRRTGALASNLAIAAGFTTGKVAYLGLGGAQDYSAYQGITMWVRTNLAFLTGVFEIRLCSDATGDVAVDTFGLTPSGSQLGGFWPVYFDKGSALGASIQSIAIYALSDPGTLTLILDNISTVKAKGASQTDNLNLTSLIAPGAGAMWWAIRGISGTTVTLEQYPGSDAGVASMGWAGTTASYDLLKWETVKVPQTQASLGQQYPVQDSGVAGNPITFSGGWNRSDMTVQNGETWLDGGWGWVSCFYNGAVRDYYTLTKINFVRWYIGHRIINRTGITHTGMTRASAVQSDVIDLSGTTDFNAGDVENTGGTVSAIGISGSLRVTFGNITGWGGGSAFSSATVLLYGTVSFMVKVGNLDTRNCRWYAIDLTPGVFRFHIGNIYARDMIGGVFAVGGSSTKYMGIVVGDIDASACAAGFVFPAVGGWRWRIGTMQIVSGTHGLSGLPPPETFIKGVTTSGNATDGWIAIAVGSMHPGRVRIKASSLTDSLPRSETGMAAYQRVPNLYVAFEDYQNVADAHRVEYGGSLNPLALLTSETGANRHTLSGLGWKLAMLSTRYTVDWPLKHALGKIYVGASALVTLRLWVNRSNTGLTVQLVMPKHQIGGVAADVVATAVASASSWEELAITFTPSESGVIMPELQVYGGTTFFAYVDDMTVLQA